MSKILVYQVEDMEELRDFDKFLAKLEALNQSHNKMGIAKVYHLLF
jgi:hypothetical protein